MRKSVILILLAAACLTACSPADRPADRPEKQPLPAETVYKGVQCAPAGGGAKAAETPQALWIPDAAALKALENRTAKRRINSGLPEPLADFDFSAHGLLFVYMGRKPTSGYSLALVPEKTFIRGQAALVTLKWQSPAPDAITAQVITHPCLFIRLPKENFTKIRVLDRQGRVKAVTGEP